MTVVLPAPEAGSRAERGSGLAARYVISRQYGELIEGHNSTLRELMPLLGVVEPNAHQRERMAMLQAERAEWIACMGRCPKFVGQVA